MRRLIDTSDYRRFWSAAAISIFGSYATLLATQIMVLELLDGDAFDLGVVNAARWVPYLLFGVVAGVYIDRWRRKPVLVSTDFGRAIVLGAIPLLYALDALTIPVLVTLTAIFGAMSLFFEGATHSYLPRVVPAELLTPAIARIEQTGAVAQSTGPLLAGALIKVVGAPVAILVDALSYVASGFLLLSVRAPERAPSKQDRNLKAELREGLAWVYHHPKLAPMAWTSHLWFVFMSMFTTVLPAYLLADDGLGFDAFWLGVAYGCGGAGAVLGGALSGWAGRRFDLGPTLVVTRLAMPLPLILVPLAGDGVVGLVTIGVSQFLFWVAMGVEGPIELSYQLMITPDELLGRMRTTIRSINRAAAVVGPLIGGIAAVTVGYRDALWIAIGGFAVSGIALAVSKVRHASFRDAEEGTSKSVG